VFDAFSADATVAIARARGAEVIQHAFVDFASQRNAALAAAGAGGDDWVLFVDADERVTPALAREIRATTAAAPARVAGYAIPRDNYLFGRLTRGAGYWPDHQLRLLRVGRARYTGAASEVAQLDGEAGTLRQPLTHYNYVSLEQFHAKQRLREPFEVDNLCRQGVRAKVYTPYLQFAREFWRRYVTLGGYREGRHGLRLALLLAYYLGYRTYRALRAEGGAGG
jgi:hypothetical protein